MNKGMNVEGKFSKTGIFEGGKFTLNNVTVIHYNYPAGPYLSPRIAFESDIHSTGLTYAISDIAEFEAVLATKVEKEF